MRYFSVLNLTEPSYFTNFELNQFVSSNIIVYIGQIITTEAEKAKHALQYELDCAVA